MNYSCFVGIGKKTFGKFQMLIDREKLPTSPFVYKIAVI